MQTPLIGQYVLLFPNGNKKLKALLRGTFLHRIFFLASADDFVTLSSGFFDDHAVYLRFSHVLSFQPKFYIGSNREHTRYRKFLQVQQHNFVLADVALRFWNSRCTRVNPTFGL